MKKLRIFLMLILAVSLQLSVLAQNKETREVRDFDEIQMRVGGKVFVTQGDKNEVILEGDDDLLGEIETEVKILRMLSNTPLQINIEFIRIHANESKNTPTEHLDTFYHLFDDIKHKQYDGLIITGAPLALLDYSQVTFWDKICDQNQ